MTQAFDITQFAAGATSFLHLKSPVDDEPLYLAGQPVGITLHNPGSDAYEAAENARTNRQLARNRKKGFAVTADILRADSATFYTAVTVSFDNLGYPPAGDATGPELFKALYADPRFAFVVEQVHAHLNDWSLFTKGSVTS